MCTQERECLFGQVVDSEVALKIPGQIVQKEWVRSAGIREEICLDEFVVMPNHLHGIVIITDPGPLEEDETHPENIGSCRSMQSQEALWVIHEPFQRGRSRRQSEKTGTP